MHIWPTQVAIRIRRRVATALLGSMLLAGAMAPGIAQAQTYRDCSGIAFIPGAAMHRCDLADSTIIGLDLHGINLARSDLSRLVAGCDPDAPRTNLADARIFRAILVDASLCDAILADADLHGTDLSRAALEDADLRRANLSRATLDGAGAGFAMLTGANLSNASWRDGSAVGAGLDGIGAHRIDLRGTSLASASLVGADLRNARLDGVDFSGADLTGLNWRRATGVTAATFADTTCPDGTNSDANGGTCAGH